MEIIIPDSANATAVHQIIYNELCSGIIREESRNTYLRIIDSMQKQGAQGIILGCTEIGLLIQQKHTTLPVFDTTVIHAEAAATRALA